MFYVEVSFVHTKIPKRPALQQSKNFMGVITRDGGVSGADDDAVNGAGYDAVNDAVDDAVSDAVAGFSRLR